jgi:hypothetical protein
MLNVVMLFVFMLNVVAPLLQLISLIAVNYSSKMKLTVNVFNIFTTLICDRNKLHWSSVYGFMLV